MGNILHANAKTTFKVRKEIQNSKETIAQLAKRLSINPKTVIKWRKADKITDGKSGPKKGNRSLNKLEEEVVCAFRRTTKFSLDDCFLALREEIRALTRSNLHRCLKRNGLNRLPDIDTADKKKKKFKEYTVGYIHIDITEIRISKDKYYLFVAIDRCCKYAYIELHSNMKVNTACSFLNNTIKEFPFTINKILTDNGSQFTYKLLSEHLRPKTKTHPFDIVCQEFNIEHRLTKFRHPWTNGQVEIMNKIIKDHTVKKYHYDDIEQLKQHLMSFILYYNFNRKLKSLKYKTPYEIIIKKYDEQPELFNINPHHKILGLNK